MFDAAVKALTQMFSPPFRRVLFKSIGLGAAADRADRHRRSIAVFSWLADSGAAWAEAIAWAAHTAWQCWPGCCRSRPALGIITGAVFLMPAVTAFVGSSSSTRSPRGRAQLLPGRPPGRRAAAWPRAARRHQDRAARHRWSICARCRSCCSRGFGLVIMFLATAYLLSREYFVLAAMRFHPPAEAKAHAPRRTRQRILRRTADRRCSCRSRSSISPRRCLPWR